MQTGNRPLDAGGASPHAQSGDMVEHAREAATFLKALAHEGRLMILCTLVEGERSVSELGEMLAVSQPVVSQQLARLRADGFVATRRQGKNVYYSLASEEVREVVSLLYRFFCEERESGPA